MNSNGFGPVLCGTLLFVRGLRKDGKYTCQYHFQSNGRRIGKIMTLEQINDEKDRGTPVYYTK